MNKQIEEMAKIACVGFREGDCENCKSVGICSSYTISEKLYNADYRKQSVGEWKYHEDCDCFYCSKCGASALNNYRMLYTQSNYCPNCGAMMKGVVGK